MGRGFFLSGDSVLRLLLGPRRPPETISGKFMDMFRGPSLVISILSGAGILLLSGIRAVPNGIRNPFLKLFLPRGFPGRQGLPVDRHLSGAVVPAHSPSTQRSCPSTG